MSKLILTLQQWQNSVKPVEQYIVQASTMDGRDGQTATSIGMAYGFALQKNNYIKCQVGNHNNLVLCAIGKTTDNPRRGDREICRNNILKTLHNNGIYNVALDPAVYFEQLPSYKFVISPEGNGIDCHRHYEALMAGCIPIVEDNPLIRAKYGNAPILWTKDYSEITQEYLEETYKKMINETWDFSRLMLSWWSPEEQQLIKIRGNFWCNRLAGTPWYT